MDEWDDDPGRSRRAVVYARISEDSTGGAAGVARQVKACHALADERGWTVVREVVDNNRSAISGARRPGYEQVLSMVRDGEVDLVVVWQTSRLVRDRGERAEAIDLFGRHGVEIVAVRGVSFDLSTAYGRGQAGLLGEFDTMESEVKAERIAAAARERAEQGRPCGTLGYGWTKHGVGSSAIWVENRAEAAVVREIVDRLLAGEAESSIAASLDLRGIPAPRGGRWMAVSVRQLAVRESNVAVRVHHRGQSDEARFLGCWPPLIDLDTYDRVCELLAVPRSGAVVVYRRQRRSAARPGARRHLLSFGVGECGVCGGVLRVATRNTRGRGRRSLYVCDAAGCVGRDQDAVDALTARIVCDRMAQPNALDAVLGEDPVGRRWMERAAGIRARLVQAREMSAAAEITVGQMERISQRLIPQLEEAEQRARRELERPELAPLFDLAGPHARQTWDAMSVASHRAAVEVLGLRVIVDRTQRRGPGFDPESVSFAWRSQRGPDAEAHH